MSFKEFTPEDWNFLESTVTVGIDAPGTNEQAIDSVLELVNGRQPDDAYTAAEMDALREAFEIGWNVATENGGNELAEEFAHVRFAVESLRPGVHGLMSGVH